MYYDMKNSGERIRQLRIKSGLTQEKAANKLNIDRSYYSRIESGKKGCSVDLLVHLSEMFHSSLDYLILGKTPRTMSTSDKTQLEREIKGLIEHLEQFKGSL